MRIILIRHAAVNIRLPAYCNSEEYDQAYAEYDRCGIRSEKDLSDILQKLSTYTPPGSPVYVSSLRRTALTAQLLFGDSAEYEIDPMLDEIPLRSCTDTKCRLPFWLWNVLARVQWFLNIHRQPETRRDSITRARKVLNGLTEKGEDCNVISHGYFLFVLFSEARRKGYLVKQDDRIHPRNLGVSIIECEKEA